MIGLGTIVNCITVTVGSTIGVTLKGGLPKRFENTIMQALGLCTIFIGIGGALSGLLTIENSALSTTNTMLLVISLALGAMIGEAIDIEEKLERIGTWCKQKFVKKDDGSPFVEAFVSASLLFCVGAMAIVGSLEDGLNGNPTILIAKAILDGIAAIIFAASLGKGVYLSVVSLLVYQGSITILAQFIRPWLTDVLISQMSCVGSVLIFAIGCNLALKTKLRIGNLLPSMFIPILIYLLKIVFPNLPI